MYGWLNRMVFDRVEQVQDAATRWLWTYNHERPNMYRIPCDHPPIRSWPLFRARDVMRGVIESFKAEQPA